MNINPEIIGSIAGILTTVCYMPQVWHCYKSKQVAGISLGMYVVLTVGIGLWLVYGAMIGSWPMVVANSITLTMILMIMMMRVRYHSLSVESVLPEAPLPE